MIILGVAFLSDASACVLEDGRLLSAVGEERLNRVKLWNGVPHGAIAEALRIAGRTMDDVDLIATHGRAPAAPDATPFDEKVAAIQSADLDPAVREIQLQAIRDRQAHEGRVLGQRTPAYLAELDVYGKPVSLYTHHTAHAASACFGSGWQRSLVLTADGWGEDASSTVWQVDGTRMEQIGISHTFDSLGYFYGSVTRSLGFVPHRHEGKVLGLAAYDSGDACYPAIREMVECDPDNARFVGRMERGVYKPRYANAELDALVSRFSREAVASATQRRLEEVVCELVDALGPSRVAVAGGVFANVKLNQRLLELDCVEDVFVFPNMGDGGLSVGAAWLAHVERTGELPAPLGTALLGADLAADEVSRAVRSSGLAFEQPADMPARVAALLADGEVVMRAGGRMEFGPRALGNRSILYKATDPGVNRWLNDRLNRSEFMPFAPATLAERAEEHFVGLAGGRVAASYMTMTFDCTSKMRRESPAAVHVDGTARPQLVSEEQYPDFHRILVEYEKRTGLASVINTSFNMHEEPIVCTADDAIRAFRASGLPWLAVGDHLVRQTDDVLSD